MQVDESSQYETALPGTIVPDYEGIKQMYAMMGYTLMITKRDEYPHLGLMKWSLYYKKYFICQVVDWHGGGCSASWWNHMFDRIVPSKKQNCSSEDLISLVQRLHHAEYNHE